MAERGRFELPIALRLCLISSQVHSTGLCHLSAFVYSILRDTPEGLLVAVLTAHFTTEMRFTAPCTEKHKTFGHLCFPVPREFSDRVGVHAGHDQSIGEGVAVASSHGPLRGVGTMQISSSLLLQ